MKTLSLNVASLQAIFEYEANTVCLMLRMQGLGAYPFDRDQCSCPGAWFVSLHGSSWADHAGTHDLT